MEYALKIKKAQINDVEAIKNITSQAFKKYISDAGITVKLDALEETEADIIDDLKTKDVFIALVNDIPVGTIRIEIKADRTAFISRFGVLPQNQKNGIGRSLISFVDNYLVSKQIKKVYLYTASKHRALVYFYYKMGFYIDSTTKDKGYIRALMAKDYNTI